CTILSPYDSGYSPDFDFW
nr:immunoglobulin heavy chain junction region [Macaca mulatta]